jgi:hypothetical protein
MANNDWRDALVLCGIPQNRVGQFNAALGVDDLEDYMELPLVDLKGDFETVTNNPAYAQVVSIRSIKKCIALRAWGEYMLLRNQDFEAADFDQQTLDRFLQYVVWLNKIDKEMEPYREAAMTPTTTKLVVKAPSLQRLGQSDDNETSQRLQKRRPVGGCKSDDNETTRQLRSTAATAKTTTATCRGNLDSDKTPLRL